jgi:hypothetical protein
MIDVLAIVGGLTIGTLAFRAARWVWKSRNWKPTPWLGLPWGV